jgi:hypothetical protein
MSRLKYFSNHAQLVRHVAKNSDKTERELWDVLNESLK